MSEEFDGIVTSIVDEELTLTTATNRDDPDCCGPSVQVAAAGSSENVLDIPPSISEVKAKPKRRLSTKKLSMPVKRRKSQNKEYSAASDVPCPSVSDLTKSAKKLKLKRKKKEVSMPSKRRGQRSKTSCGQTGTDKTPESEGHDIDKSRDDEKSSGNREMKLLLDAARSALSNKEVALANDTDVLELLLDEEYSLLADVDDILMNDPSQCPSLKEIGDDHEAALDLDTLLSDNANDEPGLLNPLQEAEEEIVTDNLSNDIFLSPATSMEDPFHLEPAPVETSDDDSDSWEYKLGVEISSYISEEWNICVKQGSVKFVIMTPFENVSVERCIAFNGTEAKTFIHNKELLPDNYIRNLEPPQAKSEFCHYLAKLAHLVLNSSVCEGVRLYQEEWVKAIENNEGYQEERFYQDVHCLRDKNCALLIPDGVICDSCQSEKNRLRHRDWRRKRQEGKEMSKVNIRFLSNANKTEKLKKLIQENVKLRKRVYNLRVSLQKFVKRGTVEVGHELGADLANIFKRNYAKLTRTQQLFWGEQMKALSRQKDLRGMRWNPFVIRLALRIQMLTGPEAYDSLRQILFLPSQRRLFDFSHFAEAKEGIQHVTLQDIDNNLKKDYKENYQQYFNFLLDEMDIRSDIVVNRRTGEVIGFQNLSPVETEMARLESEMMEGKDFHPPPAKKVLVFMLQGICNPIKEVVALYTTSGALTAPQLYSRVWNVVYHCESHNLKILTIIGDGASVNKKFFNMHSAFEDSDLDQNECPPVMDFTCRYVTINIACTDEWRPIFFIVDPPHLLKTLRNCFANSYSHKKSRFMWKDGEDISFTTIEALYAITLQCKYNATKLTKSHIKLTVHSCMKVIFAAQVMSLSVAQALHHFRNHPNLKDIPMNQLTKLITVVNNWFDCHNGGEGNCSERAQENLYLQPYTNLRDNRFEYLIADVLGFFKEWKESIQTRPGRFGQEARDRMFISHQSFESLNMTIYGFIHALKFMLKMEAPSVLARKFNQDPLEQYFGKLRMSFGGNRNPSAAQVIQKTLTLHQQSEVAVSSKKGNTEIRSHDFVPNEEKLCQRQRRV